MVTHYKPFTLARQGELLAFRRLSQATHASLTPVFVVPPRQWDFDAGDFLKTIPDFLSPLPEKLFAARGARPAYLDVSLLDSEQTINSKHPLEMLVDEADSLGLPLIPLTGPNMTVDHYAAVTASHLKHGRGVAVRLNQDAWTTTNSAALTSVLRAVGLAPAETDIFINYSTASGPVLEAAIAAEFQALTRSGFRTVTVGGSAFPSVVGTAKGITELSRMDWVTFESVHRATLSAGSVAPDYFDNLVLDPNSIELGVDPRFISISASFRYAVADRWLFTKGALFKGQGGSGLGGSALPPALAALLLHPNYGTPMTSQADVWIDDVVTQQTTPGNPTKWREWATVRHIEVTQHQLANLP